MTSILTFDPGNVEALFEQDAMYEEYGWFPPFPAGWYWQTERLTPSAIAVRFPLELRECRLGDAELAATVNDLRNAVLLPLNQDIIDGMAFLLRVAEGEARRRVSVAEKRRRDALRYGVADWTEYDLLGAVRASTGQKGRLVNGQWWFSCPFGHRDTTPSFHVQAEERRWYCFGCGKGGGVVDWRKANEA